LRGEPSGHAAQRGAIAVASLGAGAQAADGGGRLNRERNELTTGHSFADSAEQSAVDRYLNGVILYGTPAELVDEIAALREEIHLNYLLCAPLSHSSFLLFTDEVLPHI